MLVLFGGPWDLMYCSSLVYDRGLGVEAGTSWLIVIRCERGKLRTLKKK